MSRLTEIEKALPPIPEEVQKRVAVLSADPQMISSVTEGRLLADEPSLYSYVARATFVDVERHHASQDDNIGGGTSFRRDRAMVKAVCEAIERGGLASQHLAKTFESSAQDLGDLSLSTDDLVGVSEQQIEENPRLAKFRFSAGQKLQWVDGRSISDSRRVAIPAQLVFVPYDHHQEQLFRLPISTGAAFGLSSEEAILSGLLEVIERDAFMIHYLARLYGRRVDISDSLILREIEEYTSQYKLELLIFELTSDVPAYTFLALLLDRTGVGPAVTAGMKASLTPLTGITGAIEEAFQMRPVTRQWLAETGFPEDSLNMVPTTMKERALLWSHTVTLGEIDPWIANERGIPFPTLEDRATGSTSGDLQLLVSAMEAKGHQVYAVDLPKPLVDTHHEFFVVKVVVPTFHPLHLHERLPYHGGRRLYDVPVQIGWEGGSVNEETLQKFPHFFV